MAANPAIGRGASRIDPCGDHHHRQLPDARIWRHFRRISTPYTDRFRSFDRIRRIELLSLLLLLRRWGARLMAMSTDHTAEVPGFSVPVHRALTEHILLGGAPRAIAILNGTLAAALGLGDRKSTRLNSSP